MPQTKDILVIRPHGFEFYKLQRDYARVPPNGVLVDKKRYLKDPLYAASKRQYLREGWNAK
jgi:hypothetical protein